VQLSRGEPTDFCAPSKTTFSDVQYETRYTLAAVATRADSGLVADTQSKQVGSAHACVGATSDPALLNFYLEGQVSGIAFTAVGKCALLQSDFPEAGLRLGHCFLNLSALPEPYIGGFLTSNTMFSRNANGAQSDPPGYVQPSIATIRLWKRRTTGSR
jgi:hypothetical protein